MSDTELRQRHKKSEKVEEIKDDTTKEPVDTSGLLVLKIFSFLVVSLSGIAIFGFYNSELNPVMVEAPVKFEGFLEVNNVLEMGERILLDGGGPESIVVDDLGYVYTGLLNGQIVKIHRSAIGDIGEGLVEIIHSGPITGVESIDGHVKPRPLGLRLLGDVLYVIDAYYGLFSLNVQTKEVHPLVKPTDVEPSMKFPNDLDITKDGRFIYFTDTSSRWNLELLYNDVLEGQCMGRLFRYDVKTGAKKLLASKLCFPNGVQLSFDETTIAISETTRYRVLFMDLTKHGSVDKVTVVPGMPDNIRPSLKGGYWVAVPLMRTPLVNFMSDYPLLRRIFSGLLSREMIKILSPVAGLAVELDENGDIIASIHDVDGKTSKRVSEIYETKEGVILAASYSEPYIVKCNRHD